MAALIANSVAYLADVLPSVGPVGYLGPATEKGLIFREGPRNRSRRRWTSDREHCIAQEIPGPHGGR